MRCLSNLWPHGARFAPLICAIELVGSSTAQAASEPPARSDPALKSCSRYEAVVYGDHEATVQRLRQLYVAGRFHELEPVLDCLTASAEKFRSGRSGQSAVYWMFRRQFPAPGADPDESSRVAEWRRQYPSSMFVELAEIRLMYAGAWNSRGARFAGQVTEGNWALYRQGLQDAERALLSATPALRDTAMWSNLLLAVVQDGGGTATKPVDVFESAVGRWPDYYDFHEVALSRFGPLWGGSWEAVEAFAAGWTTKLRKTEGDSMYARLYASVFAMGVDPRKTRVDWARLQNSADELATRYPDPAHTNLAASLACARGDVVTSRQRIARLAPGDIRPQSWVAGTSPEMCGR